MSSRKRIAVIIACSALICIAANSWLTVKNSLTAAIIMAVIFVAANLIPALLAGKLPFRLRICRHGEICLSAFLCSSVISVVIQGVAAAAMIPENWQSFLLGAAVCVAAEAIVFWNGIISVYTCSVQLGVRRRALGIIFSMIPLLNLYILARIIHTVSKEVDFECEKLRINAEREPLKICQTKYPILLIHGVFFRDFRYLNYWGRIPAELQKNGAICFYGNQQSAASVANSAAELAARIKEITQQTGCEKVNIIAHSKGGLDSRWAVSHCGAAPYVASITTINTPHLGCGFADYLLKKISPAIQNKVASGYNATLKKLGDSSPDFMAAVRDLTATACAEFNKQTPTPEGIYCQSVGSVLKKPSGGRFPLNFTHPLVKYFDGANDGLVAEPSCRWGERYTLVSAYGKRGVSHGDMIDMNRENFDGLDIREFYVSLVSKLRERGL